MISTQQEALIGLGDEELVARVHDLVGDVEEEDVMDAIFAGLAELLERFAPDVNKRAAWRELEDDHVGDPAGRTREMDALLAGIENRAALRATVQKLGQLDTQ